MIRERVTRVPVRGLSYAVRRFEAEGAPRRGRTILLLHGFLDAGATWDRVAAPLAEAGFDVLAPDLRGFGDTDRIGAGGYYHFADYVGDLEALVAALAPERLAIVGHSMGGGVATLFTGTFPDRVERLVVMEGFGPPRDLPELSVQRMRRHLADLARIDRSPRPMSSLDEATERLAASHPRVDRAILRTRAERLTRKGDGASLVWAWDPLHRTTSPTPFLPEIYASFLREIRCPVLFVSGGPQGYHPPDEAERVANIADLTRVELPDAGHMMHWTAPDEVAAHVLRFLGD
jgi:pimeloyl-ACP methyl ester carboxylesterase